MNADTSSLGLLLPHSCCCLQPQGRGFLGSSSCVGGWLCAWEEPGASMAGSSTCRAKEVPGDLTGAACSALGMASGGKGAWVGAPGRKGGKQLGPPVSLSPTPPDVPSWAPAPHPTQGPGAGAGVQPACWSSPWVRGRPARGQQMGLLAVEPSLDSTHGAGSPGPAGLSAVSSWCEQGAAWVAASPSPQPWPLATGACPSGAGLQRAGVCPALSGQSLLGRNQPHAAPGAQGRVWGVTGSFPICGRRMLSREAGCLADR